MPDSITRTLTFTRPDDWHLHLRDGAALKAVLPHTARQFARAIVMPNLKPPVTTAAMAQAYRQRINEALPAGADFRLGMTMARANCRAVCGSTAFSAAPSRRCGCLFAACQNQTHARFDHPHAHVHPPR